MKPLSKMFSPPFTGLLPRLFWIRPVSLICSDAPLLFSELRLVMSIAKPALLLVFCAAIMETFSFRFGLVDAVVSRNGNAFQILDSIVSPVSVDVMDVASFRNRPECLGPYEAVFVHLLPINSDFDVSISHMTKMLDCIDPVNGTIKADGGTSKSIDLGPLI